MLRETKTSLALYWIALAFALAAIPVGDFSHPFAHALWTAAISGLLIAISLTIPRYGLLLAGAAAALVLLLSYVVSIPDWIAIIFGVAVGTAWVLMYIVAPLRRAVARRRLTGHS
jgi:hypothetical protein